MTAVATVERGLGSPPKIAPLENLRADVPPGSTALRDDLDPSAAGSSAGALEPLTFSEVYPSYGSDVSIGEPLVTRNDAPGQEPFQVGAATPATDAAPPVASPGGTGVPAVVPSDPASGTVAGQAGAVPDAGRSAGTAVSKSSASKPSGTNTATANTAAAKTAGGRAASDNGAAAANRKPGQSGQSGQGAVTAPAPTNGDRTTAARSGSAGSVTSEQFATNPVQSSSGSALNDPSAILDPAGSPAAAAVTPSPSKVVTTAPATTKATVPTTVKPAATTVKQVVTTVKQAPATTAKPPATTAKPPAVTNPVTVATPAPVAVTVPPTAATAPPTVATVVTVPPTPAPPTTTESQESRESRDPGGSGESHDEPESTVPPSTVAPGTTVAPVTTAPPAVSVSGAVNTSLGNVGVHCTGNAVSLDFASPGPGASASVSDAGPEKVEVHFRRGEREVEVRARCSSGIPRFSQSD